MFSFVNRSFATCSIFFLGYFFRESNLDSITFGKVDREMSCTSPVSQSTACNSLSDLDPLIVVKTWHVHPSSKRKLVPLTNATVCLDKLECFTREKKKVEKKAVHGSRKMVV